MQPAPTWRLLGLLGVALALAAVAPVLIERERAVAAMRGGTEPVTVIGPWLALIAVLAAFPIAGVPLAWIIHLRVAVTANGIGEGLSTLPGILVPYSGINEWARIVILLGAAVLLLDAAMLLAFAPPALGDIRRAGAALPLIALVVVPATLVHPSLPYLQGLLLFALLAFFMWGERVPAGPPRRGAARVRGDRRDRAGRRSRADPALAVDRLRGADARLHARARGALRLDAALRAADVAADRQHRARGAGFPQSLERRVLEDREPRHVRRLRLGRGTVGRRRRAPAGRERDARSSATRRTSR